MNDLVAAIAGDDPFGIYLKGDRTVYRGLRNSFNAAQAAWRSFSETLESLESEELEQANTAAWGVLSAACEDCLLNTSKDLEIFSWYIAAQLHGPNALQKVADGMRALTEIVEESIADMQPIPPLEKLKGESDEAKASEIAGLKIRSFTQLFGEVEGSGLLYGPIANMQLLGEITYGQVLLAENDGTFASLQARAAEVLGDQHDAFTVKVEALQILEKLIPRLEKVVKIYANTHGHPPPLIGYGTRLITDVLRVCLLLVEGLGFSWPGEDEETEESHLEEGGMDEEGAALAAGVQRRGGVGFSPSVDVTNRHEALMAIAQLAKYFRQSEPHSPICLLLDRAVRWGNLSAAQLYREILTEGSVGMSQMALMTGLESQGFSDTFGRRGASPAGGIEHPTLENYAAALPQLSGSHASPPSKAVTKPAQNKPVPPSADAPVTELASEPQKEPENDLPVEGFEW